MRFLACLSLAAACLLTTATCALAATTGIVRGTVVVDGSRAQGVDVTLAGPGFSKSTITDTTGRFTFVDVPFGSYTLTARYRELVSDVISLDVASDSIVDVPVVLGAKVLSHTTVNARVGAAGAPVSQNAVGHEQLLTLPTNNSLDRVVETVPGIVRFSQNEPVAHGFHGVTYELDGAPIPQATSSEFSDIVDPKSVDSVEIFTGAMPAEFGGSRQGAVVNIISDRPSDVTVSNAGSFTLGAGNDGQALVSFDDAAKVGPGAIFLNTNIQHTARGIDPPTFTPINDNSSEGDEFLRYVSPMGPRASLAVDFSNQLSQFQIPINIDPNNPLDPQVDVPGTDDVQLEYDRYANVNLGFDSKDGLSSVHIIPWMRYTRVNYEGDLAKDVLATQPDPNTGLPTNLIGLRQDRRASYGGLRLNDLRTSDHHAVKFGIDLSRENFTAHQVFAQLGQPDVVENVAQPGTQVGVYGQDKWSPSREVTVDFGLRYDHSTGFVGGAQLSPRIGVNVAPDDRNVVHYYFGRFYAAPQLEDVRAACVALQGCPTTPVYDLQPERDSYFEMGIAHVFSDAITGYVNYYHRDAKNVLDTTQLLNTPIEAVFNNTLGRAQGLELRMEGRAQAADSWFFSGTISQAEAAGVSGSTFLFPPSQLSDAIFQPEDHDQTYAANGAYTHRFAQADRMFATLQAEYGTGYPVQFQNGSGRLPAHLTFDASLGREAGRNGDSSLGYTLGIDNVLNHQFIWKIANGFNTTQIASGRQVLFRVTAPF